MGRDINLGDKVKDTVTGYAGTATRRAEALHASVRVCVETLVEGKVHEEWFDKGRLEHVE